MLTARNGFYAFEAALHVFPFGEAAPEIDLEAWNSPKLWRDAYGDLAVDGHFFAEDVFGNQFQLRGDGVWSFDAETGEGDRVAADVEAWARLMLEDRNFWSGYPLGHEWQQRNGPLPTGMRLLPIVPFILGGDYEVANLKPVPAIEGMNFRGHLAIETHALPDGSRVQLMVRK